MLISVLVKTIHAAKAKDKHSKMEVKRRLLNCRNTPHPATGKSPNELVFQRSVKTRLPRKTILLEKGEVEEAIEAYKCSRIVTKDCFDLKKQTIEKSIDVGDTVLVNQTKCTTKRL